MPIFTHATVGTNDQERSTAFYDSVLGTLGINNLGKMGDGATMYGIKIPEFLVFTPIDGQSATVGNGVTIGFSAPSRDAVEKFHAAGLAAGGSCVGEPGPRTITPTAYAAYLRDPDGNKICAYCFAAE